MRQIHIITGNKSKFEEFKEILRGINAELIQTDLKISETKTLDQEKVVREKARTAFEKLKKPVIADDTGIYFEEYKNFPGTYTNFVFEAIGFKGILKLLNKANKKAYFQTLLCYKDEEDEEVFAGKWNGKIITKISKKFNPDWQYNGIFLPDDCRKVLSEIPLEERANKSHRRKALDNLVKWLKEKNK